MSVITDDGNLRASLNGDASDSFLLPSLDDEDSFVVLERSTANDLSMTSNAGAPGQQSQTFQPFSSGDSFPVFNHLGSNIMTGKQAFNFAQVNPVQNLTQQFDSTNISVSAEEIQKRLQEVLHENINLKDNLYQTNLAMKQQLSTVRLLQDRASEVQKNHQAKFEETKSLILKLGSEKNELQEQISLSGGDLNKLQEEIKDLKKTNHALGLETNKLLTENSSLRQQVLALQEALHSLSETNKKMSQQSTPKEIELHKVVDQLTRKLELVERAHRQQEFDIDRLQAQVGRTTLELTEAQQKLAHNENTPQIFEPQPDFKIDVPVQFGEKFLKYGDQLRQLKSAAYEEQTRLNSLESWLSINNPPGSTSQFEIAELRRLLTEEQTQSVARKESLSQAVSTIHELLNDFQKLSEEFGKIKAEQALKESHSLAYDEMQKKGYRERLDSLTAKLVEREEALAISERHLASLQEAIRLQSAEKEDKDSGYWLHNVGGLIKPFFLELSSNGEGGEQKDEEMKKLKAQVQTLTEEVVVKGQSLQTNTEEMNSLKAEVQSFQTTVAVLEEQAKIYQSDFEAERSARESLVAEKERLLEDLRHLQRRNQELIDELVSFRNGPPVQHIAQAAPIANVGSSPPRHRENSASPPPPKPQDDVIPPPKRYFCPNPVCNMMFTTVEPLQLHVITCLKLDD